MWDIPKLYTALAEWMSCVTFLMIYRPLVETRGLKRRLVVSLLALAAVQTACGFVENILWLFFMVLAFGIMCQVLAASLKLTKMSAVYLGARAFLYAELVAAFEWQVYYYYFHGTPYDLFAFSLCSCLVVYLLLFSLVYFAERKSLPEKMQRSYLAVTVKEMASAVFLAVFFFAMSNLSYVYVGTPFTGNDTRSVFNIRTLMDVAGTLALYILNFQRIDAGVKNEMLAIQNILHKQYTQFRQSQENMDLINRKYHDLKNQIRVLREEPDAKKKGEYLDEIESGLRKYEAENKTGNSVLDTILTEKSLQFLKYGIQMTVVADGSSLEEIHVMDLCTIFGNALDNALEYEMQIPDQGKRLIRLNVMTKKGFISILAENYFEGTLEMREGLPVTTKADRRYHGYGMKSIRYTVEKYGGHMEAGVEDGWFRLRILIPISREVKSDKRGKV